MTSKEFWAFVDEEKDRQIAAHRARAQRFRETGDPAAWQGQPESGRSIFLVSKPRRGSTEKPMVVEALLRLGSQKIVEESHEIASPAQIEAYLKQREEHAAEIASMNAHMEGRRTVSVQPIAPTPRATKGN
jgi:hypothetical protein